MPAKSAWLPRIGSILAELHVLKSDYLDRHAVERIFGVRQRRARQLMGGLPTLQIGNALGFLDVLSSNVCNRCIPIARLHPGFRIPRPSALRHRRRRD
jgi:hypothetical protein